MQIENFVTWANSSKSVSLVMDFSSIKDFYSETDKKGILG